MGWHGAFVNDDGSALESAEKRPPTIRRRLAGASDSVLRRRPRAVSEDQILPMLAVIPLTGTPGEGALYPALRPGESGLRKPSWALIDQLRTVDKRRVDRVYGVVSPAELAAIDDGRRLFLGLGRWASPR